MSGTTATPTTIVNQALKIFGNDGPVVTGNYPNFDSSPAGQAAAQLYAPAVATIGRQFGWDFSRQNVALSTTGNTPPVGWGYEYVYPTSALELRQVQPSSVVDANNPLPQNWSVGNVTVSGTPAKVIWSNLVSASAVVTNNPLPTTWDPLFQEAVVRLLASQFAQALAGKLESSNSLLEQSGGFTQVGMTRPD
jgi:hypothetical protein